MFCFVQECSLSWKWFKINEGALTTTLAGGNFINYPINLQSL